MRARTVLAAATLTVTGLMMISVSPAAAAPEHPDGPGFLLISQVTAECVGLPESPALDRGVPGLAMVHTQQIPAGASPETIRDCLSDAATNPDNPVKELTDKYGALLEITPRLPQAGLPSSSLPGAEGRRAAAPAEVPLALIDGTLNTPCIGIPVDAVDANVQSILALTNVGILQDVLSSPRQKKCVEGNTSADGPLALTLDKLPRLSDVSTS
ncbi:hypothetical protein [Streptomyces sp. Je 1-332]|uniref:hypothetical protein n=1 Tax=Streptomyces sp. Je 1-332 TaxID=3231270 RepID=UPI00345A3FE3